MKWIRPVQYVAKGRRIARISKVEAQAVVGIAKILSYSAGLIILKAIASVGRSSATDTPTSILFYKPRVGTSKRNSEFSDSVSSWGVTDV